MKNALQTLIQFPLYLVSGIVPRKKNRIVFGAWKGARYADNSKSMLEYLLKRTELELIWCGNKIIENEVPSAHNVIFVKRGSWKAMYYALTSKYAFITHSYRDIANVNLLKGAVTTQLWHGIGIKNIGVLGSNNKQSTLVGRIRLMDRVLRAILRYDFFICSSEMNKERNMIVFKSKGMTSSNCICSGQPRNDVLLSRNESLVEQIRDRFYKKYGIPKNKKIITYLPTYRKNPNDRFSFSGVSLQSDIFHILETNNAILIEKAHGFDYLRGTEKDKQNNKFVYDLSNFNDIDTQELLLLTDILITAYSSCYLDYTLLDRPIIHFAHDYQKYIEEHGLYYDLDEIAGGKVVYSFDQLVTEVENSIHSPDSNAHQRKQVRRMMMEYESGNSCERISKVIGIS